MPKLRPRANGISVSVNENPTEAEEDLSAEAARPLLASGAIAGRRIVSGLQPSGALHLGNYYGAMQQHIEVQSDNDGYFFIANYHAMTTVKDRAELAQSSLDVALDYLALGLDPNRVALYRQSDVPEVTELAWVLSCVASMGDLERAVSYKDKIARGIVPSVGLFTYPVLMASDILIVRADVVPVGEDQIQHIEMTRRFAARFNRTYGRQTFAIPQGRLNEAKVVPGTDGQKMSKSYGNTIPLFAEPQAVRNVMFSIKTDSAPAAAPKNPDTDLAFALLRLMAVPDEAAEWRTRYTAGGLRYSDVKARLVELYEERFGAARERRRELAANPQRVEEILAEGARKVRKVARAVMEDVRDAVGIPVTPSA
jgi:tryptophanyl-tRNA synthetase